MTVTVEPGAGPGGVQGQLLGRAEAGRANPAQLHGTRKGFQRSCGRDLLLVVVLVLRWLVSWNDDVKTLKSSWFRNG